MQIKSARVLRIGIPFVVSFKHASAARSDVESVLLEVETDSGVRGYGECVPRDYVTGETVVSVEKNLQQYVIPALTGLELEDFDSLRTWVDRFHKEFSSLGERDLCVKAAAELALLDAFGKDEQTSVFSLLGGQGPNDVVYSAVVSAENPKVVEKILGRYKMAGLRQFKLKVGNDLSTDMQNIQLIKNVCGDQAQIRIDANEAWDLARALEFLPKYIEQGVVSVEQPMPARLRSDYPRLTSELGKNIHINVDESVCSPEDAAWFSENKGATVFNLRISKNGGILNALKIWKLAKNHGIACQLGAQVGETSLLSSAGRTLAALTGDLLFHEGSFGTQLLEYDLCKEPLVFGVQGIGPMAQLAKSPGLGVDVDSELLDRMTIEG